MRAMVIKPPPPHITNHVCPCSTSSSMLAEHYFTHNLCTASSIRCFFGYAVKAFSGDVMPTELCKPLNHWQAWCKLFQILRQSQESIGKNASTFTAV